MLCTLEIGSASLFFGSFCLLLLNILQRSLPIVCGWFVKLIGFVFDAYHSLLYLLELETFFKNVKLPFLATYFVGIVLSDFSFSLSFFGFFSAFYLCSLNA